jgi:cyanophycin synthetase
VRLTHIRRLSGPNVYLRRPVAVARLELDGLTGHETTSHAGFTAQLTGLLPGLADHHCAAGRPGGFLDAMARGTYFGHVTEHVALELSALAGRPVHFGRTEWAGADGRYDVVTECPPDEPADSPVPRDLLVLAIRIVTDILAERTPRPDAALASIAAAVAEQRLGVSTAALAEAARRRGIPARRAGGLSLLRLGYGCHRRLVWAALTDQTSAVGVDIASDKVLAKQLLADAGVPVPAGGVARSAAEAAGVFRRIGGPVVVKPRGGNHGAHVSVGITSEHEAMEAYRRASASGPEVIVETWVPGRDYRVLVVDGRVVAAAALRPASVTGDGSRDISALVARANADPRRGDGHARPLTRLALDSEALTELAGHGLGPDSVPAPGQVVALRRNANLSTGGTSTDVTDLVHPEVAAMCCRAAAAAGLDVCGLDVRLTDISAPLAGDPGAGAVIELNACPGLRMHLAPSAGRPRDVAGAIIDRLYPPGVPARIPIVSVTGTNGKTTTVRMISHILRQAGLRVGMTTTDGISIGGQVVQVADASGPQSAELVLDDPTVEAAVLETARGGILRRGLGYDQADVAVLTNITADHLGADGIDDLDDLTHIKSLVAEEIRTGGTLVLNADDPRTAALATRAAVRRRQPVIRYFGLDGRNPVMVGHRMAGGITCELRGTELVEAQGGEETVLLPVTGIPGSFGGAATHLVANALAAVSACRALGVSVKDIRRALAAFTPLQANPGRGNVYQVAGCPVVVDYGHNPAAIAAMGSLLREAWDGDPVAAITLPGDRRDDLVAETAATAAVWFGRVVVYEDSDLRGRQPGEMTRLISAALERQRPGITIVPAAGPDQALRRALGLAAPGDPVLFLYEKLAPVQEVLGSLGAVTWPAGAPAADDVLAALRSPGCPVAPTAPGLSPRGFEPHIGQRHDRDIAASGPEHLAPNRRLVAPFGDIDPLATGPGQIPGRVVLPERLHMAELRSAQDHAGQRERCRDGGGERNATRSRRGWGRRSSEFTFPRPCAFTSVTLVALGGDRAAIPPSGKWLEGAIPACPLRGIGPAGSGPGGGRALAGGGGSAGAARAGAARAEAARAEAARAEATRAGAARAGAARAGAGPGWGWPGRARWGRPRAWGSRPGWGHRWGWGCPGGWTRRATAPGRTARADRTRPAGAGAPPRSGPTAG